MSKRPSLKKDFAETAFSVFQKATGEEPNEKPGKNAEAAQRGREGGLKGGRARAEKLTEKERSEVAKKGAKARWLDK